MTNPLDEWIAELAGALDLDPSSVDSVALLDLARDAAHGIARPAAPLTTFLVGLAAGMRDGTAEATRDAVELATRLIAAHSPPETD